ncbi:5994_t:CDS:2 [Ambispora gerdemannii]|uniref:5994_t:CDS:1 n=1 Tax=Ambispora gerdemannii TaxID=144530 RepID=A0A9N8YKZ5_9GLOM|nr:5994_t:CDS:2 [Ambispora gerdemannii]
MADINSDNTIVGSTSVDDFSQYEHLKPAYPLPISLYDLVKRRHPKAKPMNPFFIYRRAMVKQNEKQKRKERCDMPKLSKIASKFWREEPSQVRDHYRQLAELSQILVNDYSQSNLDFSQPQVSTTSLDFHQGASFNGHPQTIPAHYSTEDLVYGISSEENTTVQYPSNLELLNLDPVKEASISYCDAIADKVFNNAFSIFSPIVIGVKVLIENVCPLSKHRFFLSSVIAWAINKNLMDEPKDFTKYYINITPSIVINDKDLIELISESNEQSTINVNN